MNNSNKIMYVNKFLRAFPDEFTLKEFVKCMSYLDCKISPKEAQDLIDSSPYVVELESGKFKTRAGCFSGKIFSAILSEEECSNQCFLPGHRCMPFVDQEIMSYSLNFVWDNNILEKKFIEYPKEFALEHFSLYGEEYESQYIANDPGMEDYNIAEHDFELPMKVKLTSIDLSSLFKKYKIKAGDRLLFSVENWDEGIINVMPLLREKNENLELTEDDILRNQWYKAVEKSFLLQFKERGPRSSIEEELAELFIEFEEELCTKFCGSIEEFLKRTKKVSVELFGVETRLWFAGKAIPVIGPWNQEPESRNTNKTKYNLIYSVPKFIIDEYIKDFAYQKKTDMTELMDMIFPHRYFIPDTYRKDLLLHITNRNDIILSEYNWFADHQIGDIRHNALLLYTKINGLVYEIDRSGGRFNLYPQQELVILIQLFNHLTKLIESIAFEPESLIDEANTIAASLDGMEFNFEDIEDVLRSAIFASKKQDFTVID